MVNLYLMARKGVESAGLQQVINLHLRNASSKLASKTMMMQWYIRVEMNSRIRHFYFSVKDLAITSSTCKEVARRME